jgi:hypothetical protein
MPAVRKNAMTQKMKTRRTKPRPGQLNPKSYSGLGHFIEWNLDAREEFNKLLDEMIREGLNLATKEYECFAELEGTDPVEIVVTLPIGRRDYEGPEWRFSLADMIKDQIGMYDRHDCDGLKQIRDSLVALVDIIDEVIVE